MFRALKLYTGLKIDLEQIFATLVDFGYKRQEMVYAEGEFSRRGGIIDIYPLTFECPLRIELDAERIASIKSFDSSTGKTMWEHNMVIVLPVKKISTTRILTYHEELPLDNTIDLNTGDYVVHINHGIGRFLGVEKIKIAGSFIDHFVIEYDRQEKLYVPVSEMHLIQKYIGFNVRRPKKLSRLGTKEWLTVKERAKKGIQRYAWELLSLQALRMSVRGFRFSPDTDWQGEFERIFAFEETPDQKKAAQEVKKDMESERPMDRLICGDVGYGKTEVAMRAAFKAVMDNKQVAFLVPTTVLAEQHYQNFTGRLVNFPINVAMLSRFKTHAQQKAIIKALADGTVDIVIGTHRLLSSDIAFKNLGLVIIDEEQRFGVASKEKLKSLRLNSDVLTLTATPIPRTLYMSLMGVKDFSIINTPPKERFAIKTHVLEYDDDLIQQAILKEAGRRGQTYFVHNHVFDIAKIKLKLLKLLPAHIRIAVAHGQMGSSELEAVMVDFLKGDIDVLVSTTIVESGIDVPNANTLIVNNAHDFGLSDLHQLRGRVGRFNRRAHAFFLVPHQFVSSDAQKRLEALQSYSDLGSGFKIAMRDLEIRGAGNLLGMEQHGFVASIGFDLYCRLLKETISSLKNIRGKLN